MEHKEDKMDNKKDILLFISDQHDGRITAPAGDKVVRTPALDRLAEDGVFFENAYTACPLCVPARMAMLSGKLPSKTGIFTNKASLNPETPTFLHSMANAGYETVLCGRMHFEGDDQRHGFTKRIAYDITQTAAGATDNIGEQTGPYYVTMTDVGCLQVVGGGNSAVLEYDRYVVAQALEYLSKPHDKPQCIVVGTYAPHFPYVAPKELYDYYYDKVELPPTLDEAAPTHPACAKRAREASPDIVRAVRAAYWGMIEFEDSLIGSVREAWEGYLKANGRVGIFLYVSDHGDHAGDRGFYGKQSLYESSVRIPFFAAGSGVVKNTVLKSPISLLDISPTFCEIAGAKMLPEQDGISIVDALFGGKENPERAVVSEWINNPYFKGTEFGRMVRKGEHKLMTFADFPESDLLVNPESDYWETENLADKLPEKAAELRKIAYDRINPERIVADKNNRDSGYDIVAEFNRNHGVKNTETWTVSDKGRSFPEHFVSTKQPMPPHLKALWDKAASSEKGDNK